MPLNYSRDLFFGMVFFWNALPQDVVALDTVKSFQGGLQNKAKEVVKDGCSISDLCDLRWIQVRYGKELHTN